MGPGPRCLRAYSGIWQKDEDCWSALTPHRCPPATPCTRCPIGRFLSNGRWRCMLLAAGAHPRELGTAINANEFHLSSPSVVAEVQCWRRWHARFARRFALLWAASFCQTP